MQVADNQEEIVYSYTGDTSSLREATQEAISILGKFDNAMKTVASKNSFNASVTSVTTFQRAVGSLVKQVNTLTTALNSTGSSLDSSVPDGATIVEEATKDLADVLSYLEETTSVTSEDLKFLTTVLQSTKKELNSVTGRVQVFSSSMRSLEQLHVAQELRETNQAAKEVQSTLSSATFAGYRVQEAYEASGKSAIESARAYLEASRSAESIDSVQAVIKRIQLEMSLLGVRAKQAWDVFASKIEPVTVKIQSFKDKTFKIFDKIKAVILKTAGVFKRTSTEADTTGNSFRKLSERASMLASSAATLFSRVGKGRSSFNLLSKAVSEVRRTIETLTGVQLGDWLHSAMNRSIDFTENLNLFRVAMGDAVSVGNEFISQMAELYGMDPSNLMRFAGNFYQLSDAVGTSTAASSIMSLQLTKTANDLSSLFNVPIEDAFEDLSSGMQGMTRAMRKYGVDIRTTTLQQTALSLGVQGHVESMSEANRQGLRFITIMRQSRNASGDFARTIESPANQLKIFKEQMSQLGRVIGDIFIRYIARAIQYINGFVMALRMAISFLSSILGLVSDLVDNGSNPIEDTADAVDNVGSAAAGATKKLKAMLAPFDELNVLSKAEPSGGAGGSLSDLGTIDPKIQQAIENMRTGLEDIRMKAVEVRDALLAFFGFKVENGAIISWDVESFETNLIEKFPEWSKTIEAAFDNWSKIVDSFKNLFRSLGEVAKTAWKNVGEFFNKFVNDDSVSSFIQNLSAFIDSLSTTLQKNKDSIGTFVVVMTAAVGALATIFKFVVTHADTISTFFKMLSSGSGGAAGAAGTAGATGFLKLFGIIGLVVSAIVILYNTSEKFAESLSSLVSGLSTSLPNFIGPIQEVLGSLKSTWDKDIVPMLGQIGTSLAPAIDTLLVLWQDLSQVLQDAFNLIASTWKEDIEPVISDFAVAIGNLATELEHFWNEVVGPTIEEVSKGLKDLWTSTLKPIIDGVIELLKALVTAILLLWNNVLHPLILWIIDTFGPGFAQVFNYIWGAVSMVIESIGLGIQGLLKILTGLITFLTGVFSGDWELAWQGMLKIFEGVWLTIQSVFKLGVNAILGVINFLLVNFSSAINRAIRAVNKLSFTIPDWVPGLGGKKFSPNLKEVGVWSIPYLADGAVVTGPTVAMIGEGQYDEAVLPLGNSPQMTALVNQIANAVSNRSTEPVQVNVFIGNEQLAEYTYRVERRQQLQTNGGM